MNLRSPGASRANSHFASGGKAGAAAAAHLAAGDLREQLLGGQLAERAPQTLPVVAGREQLRAAGQRRCAAAARRRPASARQHALHDTGAGVDDVAVAERGRGVAEAEADGLGERDGAVGAALAERQPTEALAQRVDVRIAGRREAGGAGADAKVARAARLEQVVVERRDAVDGRLRQPGALGGESAVVVGDLAALLHRLLEDLQRGRSADRVVAADDLDEVA